MNGNEITEILFEDLTTLEQVLRAGVLGRYLSLNTIPTAFAFYGLMILGYLACMVIPYLIGSLNIGILISQKIYKQDVRDLGSKNAGATNMARVFGMKAGLLTIACEFLKTAIAVCVGRAIFGLEGMYIAGLFAIIGQMFPIFFKFKGGKGVAATGAVILLINPVVFLILIAVFIIIVAGTKYVSLASIMALLLYPLVLNRIDGPGISNIIALITAALVWYRHKENIIRLWNKQERKFEFKRKKKRTDQEESVLPVVESTESEDTK